MVEEIAAARPPGNRWRPQARCASTSMSSFTQRVIRSSESGAVGRDPARRRSCEGCCATAPGSRATRRARGRSRRSGSRRDIVRAVGVPTRAAAAFRPASRAERTQAPTRSGASSRMLKRLDHVVVGAEREQADPRVLLGARALTNMMGTRRVGADSRRRQAEPRPRRCRGASGRAGRGPDSAAPGPAPRPAQRPDHVVARTAQPFLDDLVDVDVVIHHQHPEHPCERTPCGRGPA